MAAGLSLLSQSEPFQPVDLYAYVDVLLRNLIIYSKLATFHTSEVS